MVSSGKRKKTFPLSKKARRIIITVLAALAIVIVLVDRADIGESYRGRMFSQESVSSRDVQKYHEKTFTVTNIVDGDTLDIDVMDGSKPYTRIRLWGIDTPETTGTNGSAYYAAQAKEKVADLCLDRQVTVHLDPERRTRGYYGRLLAYVELPNGEILNELLVEKGYAYADLRFEHDFYHKYQDLQKRGRRKNNVLWQQVTTKQLPDWLRKRKPDLLD